MSILSILLFVFIKPLKEESEIIYKNSILYTLIFPVFFYITKRKFNIFLSEKWSVFLIVFVLIVAIQGFVFLFKTFFTINILSYYGLFCIISSLSFLVFLIPDRQSTLTGRTSKHTT